MKINILGINIDDENAGTVLKRIEDDVLKDKKIFIATPNPEMIILAQKDANFKNILNSTDINIPDGFGLKIGAKILGKKLNSRVTGTDLMVDICRLANKKRYSIYLLGGGKNVARMAVVNLKKEMPRLKITGAEEGGKMDEWDNRVIIKHINVLKPDILFVALGHGKQEKWIHDNFKELASVKLAIGVGGAFDFISGKVKRAPKWMRTVGLEWLWRLVLEPKRLKRIINATLVFPWLCFKNKNRN